MKIVGKLFFCAAIAFEAFYQSVAGNYIRIGHVLESSRKFRTQEVRFSRVILHGKTKQKHGKSPNGA